MKDETPGVRVLSASRAGSVAPGNAKAIETLGLALAGDSNINVRNAAASAWAGWGRRSRPGAR